MVCKLATLFRLQGEEICTQVSSLLNWACSQLMLFCCLMLYCFDSILRLRLVGPAYQLFILQFPELFCRDMSMCHRTAILFVVCLLYCTDLSRKALWKAKYRQASNIRCVLIGNEIADHSDVVGASPVGTAPAQSSFSTKRTRTKLQD